MKKLLFFVALFITMPVAAGQLPDNMYFRAMQDEMKRTVKELRTKENDGQKPFYVAYKLTRDLGGYSVSASMGSPLPVFSFGNFVLADVLVDVGSRQHDSLGFDRNSRWEPYAPTNTSIMPNGYDGIRQGLWGATNTEFVKVNEVYKEKQAYKRKKNLLNEKTPDFAPAAQSSYVEELNPLPYPDMQVWQEVVNKLSSQGKDLPYVEKLEVVAQFYQTGTYYLNSDGGFYQTFYPAGNVYWNAVLRTKNGYKDTEREWLPLPSWNATDNEKRLQEKTDKFLAKIKQHYQAQKGTAYLGPVLFTKDAAGSFMGLLVRGVEKNKPLLSAAFEDDPEAGELRNKVGMRVMSMVADVYDRPHLREFKGRRLPNFAPVDDEGVATQDLTLVSGGKLVQLPSSRRSVKKGEKSNGHAFFLNSYPRERLTTVVVEPKNPLSEKELEAKLLARCKELELDYCYIVPNMGGTGTMVQRIYTADGRKEPVTGLEVSNLTTRALRDILAAGDESDVYSNVITPALLVDEIELLPSDRRPDRKPFIARP